MNKENHFIAGDVLRGIAILMVVIYHAFGNAYGFYVPWRGWYRDLASPSSQPLLWCYPITIGWTGVALFFVLSGFCIHLSFLRSKNFSLDRFFWRRFWRIYPAYFAALLVFYIARFRFDIFHRYEVIQFLTHALFLHNISGSTFYGINASFWSIATEVQFYLLFPCLLFLRSRFQIFGCLVVTFVIALVWRAVAVLKWGLPDHCITTTLSFPLMTWFDWTLGAFVAERFFHGRPAFTRKGILLSILIPLFVASTLYKPLSTFSFSLAAAVSAIILDGMLYVSWKKSFWLEGITWVGVISYSLYLWHQPCLQFIAKIELMTGSAIVSWLILVLIIIFGSWLSFRFLEQFGISVGEATWRRFHAGPDQSLTHNESTLTVCAFPPLPAPQTAPNPPIAEP